MKRLIRLVIRHLVSLAMRSRTFSAAIYTRISAEPEALFSLIEEAASLNVLQEQHHLVEYFLDTPRSRRQMFRRLRQNRVEFGRNLGVFLSEQADSASTVISSAAEVEGVRALLFRELFLKATGQLPESKRAIEDLLIEYADAHPQFLTRLFGRGSDSEYAAAAVMSSLAPRNALSDALLKQSSVSANAAEELLQQPLWADLVRTLGADEKKRSASEVNPESVELPVLLGSLVELIPDHIGFKQRVAEVPVVRELVTAELIEAALERPDGLCKLLLGDEFQFADRGRVLTDWLSSSLDLLSYCSANEISREEMMDIFAHGAARRLAEPDRTVAGVAAASPSLNMYLSRHITKGKVKIRDYGLVISTLSDYRKIYDEIFLRKDYDFESDSAAPVIIDAGANIGLATLFMKMRYPDAQVTAIEPDPAVFELLEKNVRSWDMEEDIQLINAAVSDTTGTALFERSESSSLSSHLIEGEIEDQVQVTNKVIEVPTLKLSTMIDQPIDFLKIDIEGGEWVVFEDVRPLLHQVKNIFIELHMRDRASWANLPGMIETLIDSSFELHLGYSYWMMASLTKTPYERIGNPYSMTLFGKNMSWQQVSMKRIEA